MTGLRPARAGDASLLERLERRVGALDWRPGMLAAELDRPIARAWIAEENGRPVGYLLGWLLDGHLEIVAVGVVPEARRAGWGRRLVREALRTATDGAWLEVREDNRAALSLYLDCGFRVVGRRTDYYGPGRDALTLSWTPGAAGGTAHGGDAG